MAFDRAIGALCVGGAVVVFAVGLVAGSSSPTSDSQSGTAAALGPVDDRATIEAFVDMNARSERVPRVLDAVWERRNDGTTTLDSPWHEVRDAAGNHLTQAFGNLDGVYDGEAIFCGAIAPTQDDASATSDEQNPVEPEPEDSSSIEPGPPDDEEEDVNPLDEFVRVEGFSGCRTGPAPEPEAELATSREALESILDPASGTYTVQQAPQRRLAGVDATCFVLRRRGDAGWAFGAETTLCWSPEAIPLLVERREGTVVDTRRTTSISTDVTDADFEALLDPWRDALATTDVRSAQ